MIIMDVMARSASQNSNEILNCCFFSNECDLHNRRRLEIANYRREVIIKRKGSWIYKVVQELNEGMIFAITLLITGEVHDFQVCMLFYELILPLILTWLETERINLALTSYIPSEKFEKIGRKCNELFIHAFNYFTSRVLFLK